MNKGGISAISFQLSPHFYHRLVRPKWFTKRYIHDHLIPQFSFHNRSVLDFGCGTGANCLMTTPASYLGIDPDERRIQYASRQFPEYKFVVMGANEIPVEDHTIDYVWIVAVLHHIPSEAIRIYLKEFRRILKNGGQVIVIEPFFADEAPLCNRFMKWFDRGQYIRDKQQYLQLFKELDFSCTILKSFRKCFVYNELFFTAKVTN